MHSHGCSVHDVSLGLGDSNPGLDAVLGLSRHFSFRHELYHEPPAPTISVLLRRSCNGARENRYPVAEFTVDYSGNPERDFVFKWTRGDLNSNR